MSLFFEYLKFLIFGDDQKKEEKILLVAEECATELLMQISEAGLSYSTEDKLKNKLTSKTVTAFMFGFISYYAEKNKLNNSKNTWSLTVLVFHKVYNSDQYGLAKYGEQLEIIKEIIRNNESKNWIMEGKNAALYGKENKINLFTSFLIGGSS
jgi:hypothetical protein